MVSCVKLSGNLTPAAVTWPQDSARSHRTEQAMQHHAVDDRGGEGALARQQLAQLQRSGHDADRAQRDVDQLRPLVRRQAPGDV
jgi:hypothetical protein